MNLSRRAVVQVALLAAGGLAWGVRASGGASAVDIEMRGSAGGSSVWFDPVGILIEPGQTVRWINADRGNAHTATAYHPANGNRPLRIPAGAEAWDSGYLMPGESFSVTLGQEGVYDYVCLPHEMAGMVGRIVVGHPDRDTSDDRQGELPDAARRAFPSVDDILRHGAVRVAR